VIIAASLISITVNTPFVTLAVRLGDRLSAGAAPPAEPRPGSRVEDMRDHVVLVGYGRVGSTVAAALQRAGAAYVVVEEIERVVAGLRLQGARAVLGDATRREVLDRAGISRAKLLVVTAPEPIRARRIVEVAREARPALDVAVRTHSGAEQEFFEATLEAGGARGRAVYAEREAALGLAHYALQGIGRSDDQADVVVDAIREDPPPPPDALLTGEVPDPGMPQRRSTD
jgi:CPA2 family monovalent cation:H+ antiporter-2